MGTILTGKKQPKISMSRSANNGFLELLSPAEQLVAAQLAGGFSNKEIAQALGKAEPTVKHQVSSILRSANVQSRGRFIALYYQQSLCLLPMTWPNKR